MDVPVGIIFIAICAIFILVVYVWVLRARNTVFRRKLNNALHNKAEITNFLSLFSKNLRSMDEIDHSMNMTARYVADLIESQSICIFDSDGENLKAVGVSGAFPPLHKSNEYVLTRPKYILESLKRAKIKVGEGLIGEIAATRETLYLEDASLDSRVDANSVVPISTLMAVPLIHEGSVTGVICAVNNRRSDRSFSAEQFNRFKFIASQVVLAQNIVKVYSNLSEQQRINQELEFARELQASLLPDSFPAWDQFVVHSFTRACKEVSGDFYDFVEIDDDRLLIVVGDATGKGIPACLIMAMTRSFIRSSATRFTTLHDMLCELNDNLFRDTDEERFITLACCLLNKKESTIEYARAGHTELQLYVRKHIRSIYPDGAALGLLPCELADFDTLCIEFTPEMSILLFTDGISEAINEEGEEFGPHRIRDEFRNSSVANDPPEETTKKILDSIDNFTGAPEHQTDDQTMVIIRHL